MDIRIRELSRDGCGASLLDHYDRYQETKRMWKQISGEWTLTEEGYTEQWDKAKKRAVIESFAAALEEGGRLVGAFDRAGMIGFVLVEAPLLGRNKEYVNLDMCHVSCAYRGKGIGKALFEEAKRCARELGAKKLYIGANPAEDTIAFYKKRGCTMAKEILPSVLALEPTDCQLECPV